MGVDSKVFVIADQERALDVGKAVYGAIRSWINNLIKEEVETLGFGNSFQLINSDYNKQQGTHLWDLGASISSYDFGSFTITFTVKGESRILWYHTDCSCDTDDITKEHTLLFSIGYWGLSEEIMQIVIEALKPFGKVYYDFNDCDDKDYVLQN